MVNYRQGLSCRQNKSSKIRIKYRKLSIFFPYDKAQPSSLWPLSTLNRSLNQFKINQEKLLVSSKKKYIKSAHKILVFSSLHPHFSLSPHLNPRPELQQPTTKKTQNRIGYSLDLNNMSFPCNFAVQSCHYYSADSFRYREVIACTISACLYGCTLHIDPSTVLLQKWSRHVVVEAHKTAKAISIKIALQ